MNITALSIGGADVETSHRTPVINPATEDVCGYFFEAEVSHALDACLAVDAAFAEWSRVPAPQKRVVLREIANQIRKHCEDIAATITSEVGKPLAEARAEVGSSAASFEWAAEEIFRMKDATIDGFIPGNRVKTRRQPIGPVLALTPWNFPFNLPARKVASALAAGCSVILRPAPEAPASAAALVACCIQAGLPHGAVNLLLGHHEATVKPLMADPRIRCVSLTGSMRVGQILIAQSARTVKPLILELGGHAPVIVLADADVGAAAKAGALAKFRNAGQVCVSPTRFIVDETVYDRFVETFLETTRQIVIGNGADPATTMGPLTTSRQLAHIEALVADAIGQGATLACGGCRVAGQEQGFFYEPTVLLDVPAQANVQQEEPFGPLAIINRFSEVDEAIALANSNEAGLAGYIFGKSQRLLDKVADALEVGLVGVNTMALSAVEAPFGGVKQSGYGKEGGRAGIEAFQIVKTHHIAGNS